MQVSNHFCHTLAKLGLVGIGVRLNGHDLKHFSPAFVPHLGLELLPQRIFNLKQMGDSNQLAKALFFQVSTVPAKV